MNITKRIAPILAKHTPVQKDWGISIVTETELEAFQIAYIHRNSKFGVQVRYLETLARFEVTIFNELAAKSGIDRS